MKNLLTVAGQLSTSEITLLFSELEKKALIKGDHFEYSQTPVGEIREVRIIVRSVWADAIRIVLTKGKMAELGVSEKFTFA